MSMADLLPFISASAQKYNLDPSLVQSVVQQESKGNANAHNTSGGGQGAWGPMQVRAPALADYNAANGTSYKPSDLTSPQVGMEVGSWYLNQQLTKFSDPQRALAAYNQGAASDAASTGNSPYASQVLARVTGGSQSPVPSAAQQGAAPQAAQPSAGAANVLAQFGYGADGHPLQSGAAPQQNAPQAAQPAQASGANAAAVLAQFGYGPDGHPVEKPTSQQSALAAAPAQPSTTQPVQPQSQQDKFRGAVNEIMSQDPFDAGMTQGVKNLLVGGNQMLANAAKTGANTFLAPDSALSRMVNTWAQSANQTASSNDQQQPSGLLWKAGEFVGEAVPTMVLPGGTLMKALGSGALAGAAQPVAQNADDHFWAQKGVQAGLGAALGGAGDLAAKGIGSVIQRFAPQESEALTNLRNFLSGQKVEAQPQPEVAGVQPTLAEMTGNQNIGVAQRQFQQANPEPFQTRETSNAAARENAFNQAAGSPYEAEQAAQAGEQRAAEQYASSGVDQLQPDAQLSEILQRPSMKPVLKRAESLAAEDGNNLFETQRQQLRDEQNTTFNNMAGTPEDVESAREARLEQTGDDYQFAENQTYPVDAELAQLLQRPSFTRRGVFQRAQNLADEQDAGPLITEGEDGQPQDISGQALHYIKQGLDDLLSNAKTEGIGANERRAILGTQNQLLDWFDQRSDEYARARANYQALSQPVDAMEYLQGLNVTDANGDVNLGRLDTAIKNTDQLRASPKLNAAQALTDDQMQQLYSIRDNLRQAQSGPDVSRFNPQQIQYVQRALDDEMAKGTPPATANSSDSIAQSRQDLENWLGQRAPGYQVSKATAQAAQRGLETNQYMQKDISDSMGRLQLSRVEQKIKQIENDKRLGLDTPAGRIDDKTLSALHAIRDSMRNETQAQAMPRGSPTQQNREATARLGLATPAPEASAGASALAHMTGVGAGGAAGWTVGHLLAPGFGGAAGSALGSVVGGALQRRALASAAAKQQSNLARLLDEGSDMFLNPTPELINKLNNAPAGQQLLRMINLARGRAGGIGGVIGGGPVFRGATQ